jgi:hypothetical protein
MCISKLAPFQLLTHLHVVIVTIHTGVQAVKRVQCSITVYDTTATTDESCTMRLVARQQAASYRATTTCCVMCDTANVAKDGGP